MRRLTMMALGASAFFFAGPVFAQDNQPESTPIVVPSPEDDLSCALFTAFVLDQRGGDVQSQESTGIVAGLTYFLGRYEAVRDGDLAQAMVEHYQALTMEEFGNLGKICGPRMTQLSQRMQAASAAMQVIEQQSETADKAE